MSRTLRLTLALSATTSALLLAPTAAHADVTNMQVGCNGASGHAGSFVTLVQAMVDGREIGRDVPAGTWSIGYQLEGDHVVTIYDRTAGNDHDRDNPDFPGDTSHGGPNAYVVASFKVSCPVATTTTVAPTTTEAATTTTVEATTTLAPTTTEAATTTEPVVTIEPTTVVPVETIPETSVTLGTAPVPSSVVRQQEPTTTTQFTFAGHDDFFVADSTTTMPVPVLSESTIPTTEASTSTLPGGRLPETGTDPTALLAAGLGLLGAGGVLARLGARRRPNLSA